MKFLLLVLLITLAPKKATSGTWVINDQHTQVQFEIGYMGIMKVSGLFTNVRGKFLFDQESKIAKDIIFQISTKSIQTHNNKRDRHLKRSDFFYSEKFPWIEATIDQVNLGNKKAQAIVNLNIKENLQAVSVTIDVIGIKKDPWDQSKKSLFLKLSGKINRQDFGLNWNKELDNGDLLIAQEVDFSVNIEANPSDQKLAFSRFFLPTGQKTKYNQVDPSQLELEKVEKSLGEENATIAPKTTAKDHTNPASFISGFVIFVLITVVSIFIKIKLQVVLEKSFKKSKIFSEIISDLVLLSFVILAFMLTAPLMGYGK